MRKRIGQRMTQIERENEKEREREIARKREGLIFPGCLVAG